MGETITQERDEGQIKKGQIYCGRKIILILKTRVCLFLINFTFLEQL